MTGGHTVWCEPGCAVQHVNGEAVWPLPMPPNEPQEEPPEVAAARAAQTERLAAGDPEGPDQMSGPTHAQRVQSTLARMRATVDAKAIFDAEQAHTIDLPQLVRLDRFLEVPDDPVTYRIDRVWPTGGRVMAAAPRKSGKTTLNGNLMRSLVDGDRFLGKYTVSPMVRLILLDNELDERMLRRWLRDHHIQNPDRIELVTLRGRLSAFNILDPATRARWAAHLGPADGLIFDCLRPALDALGLDEWREAGRFLEALDELLAEAGIGEALVTHHHGHADERARGDSRIVDWPDANWNLVEGDQDGDTRQIFFKARGRDVDEPEQLLAYDPNTRRLTIGGGSRKQTRDEDKHQKQERAVMAVIGGLNERLNTTEMDEAVKAAQTEADEPVGFQRGDMSKTLYRLLAKGLVSMVEGGNNRKLWARITLVDGADQSTDECSSEGGDPLV